MKTYVDDGWEAKHPAPDQKITADGRPTLRYLMWQRRQINHYRLVELRKDFVATVKRGYEGTKKTAKTVVKKTWAGLKGAGYGVGWLVTGTLNVVGSLTYRVVRLVGTALAYLLAFITLLLVVVLTMVAWLVSTVVFLVVKVVQGLCLVLSTPWLALHDVGAAKTDWRVYVWSLHPRNIHILFPEYFGTARMEARATARRRAAYDPYAPHYTDNVKKADANGHGPVPQKTTKVTKTTKSAKSAPFKPAASPAQ